MGSNKLNATSTPVYSPCRCLLPSASNAIRDPLSRDPSPRNVTVGSATFVNPLLQPGLLADWGLPRTGNSGAQAAGSCPSAEVRQSPGEGPGEGPGPRGAWAGPSPPARSQQGGERRRPGEVRTAGATANQGSLEDARSLLTATGALEIRGAET